MCGRPLIGKIQSVITVGERAAICRKVLCRALWGCGIPRAP
jgi:hypothetical protein